MKTSRLSTWLFSGMCAFAAISCNDKKAEIQPETDTSIEKVHVRYVQTQCADRWGQAQGAQALIAAAQAYLTQRNLTLYQPTTSNGSPSACAACTCPTGLVLEGDVRTADLSAVQALGFTQ
jgi:hypothetical protein